MMEMWEKRKAEWVAKIQEKTGWSEAQAQAFYKQVLNMSWKS